MCLNYLAHFSSQAMTIVGFNDGRIDATTLKQVLSLGPTFVVMKLIESEILFLLLIIITVELPLLAEFLLPS